ncbi:dehydrogenase/reductase SDR family member 13 isoform 2-T2 [Erethizon dorsatum]
MEALLLSAGLLLGAYVLIYYNLVKAPQCGGIGSLRGRTAVVTGANSGIGKMTALELARRGARVVLACRSRERGEAAAFDLRQESGNNEVIFMALDLASLASVRAFATAFLSSEPRLDVLIHNAGISSCGRTREAFNLLLRVNHIGPFLLTHLLLPRLKTCAPSRVVVISSAAHRRGHLDFTRLDRPVVGWQQELRAYADRPVNSELFLRHIPGWLRPLLCPLAWLVLRTPKGGAQTPLYCALQEGIEPFSGRYFANCHVEEVLPAARDDRVAYQLWEASMRLAGLGPEEEEEPDEEPQLEDLRTPSSLSTPYPEEPTVSEPSSSGPQRSLDLSKMTHRIQVKAEPEPHVS